MNRPHARALGIATALACTLFLLGLGDRPPTGEDGPDEGPAFGEPTFRGGAIVAWNNAYPDGIDTAKWYAQQVGFTDSLLGHVKAAAINGPYLRTGIRVYPGRPPRLVKLPEDAAGATYFYYQRRRVMNPRHPEAIRAIRREMDLRFNPAEFPAGAGDRIRIILIDSEGVVPPPRPDPDDPNQVAAIRLIEQAAREAGVLREGESLPEVDYGTVLPSDELFDADGALRTDSTAYRVMDWWWVHGGGPARIWKETMGLIRSRLPKVYAATDPVCGTASQPPAPLHALKPMGLDFAMNWFAVTGESDRMPIYAAVVLQQAKASGLPVVQGPHFFPWIDTPKTYSRDLLLTANLLTLAFNPRNGAKDPDTPWGIVHWGMRRVTKGVDEQQLRRAHKDAAPAIFANLAENQRQIVSAVRATRRFMDENAELLSEMEDLPAPVGIVETRASAYVAAGHRWWDYHYRIGEYPLALLMAHVPFEFVPENGDLDRYELLIIPHSSYVTDRLVDRLARFPGKVTGSDVPAGVRAKIPGWVDPPPVSEVGSWPWGDQQGYALGGHFRKMEAARIQLWLTDRSKKIGRFVTEIVGEPDVTTDPETLIHVVRWRDRRVVIAVNHRMRATTDAMAADRCLPHETEIAVKGHFRRGRYDASSDTTRFAVKFDGPGARVIVLDPVS